MCKGFPVSSSVISVCGSVSGCGVARLCGDDDGEVIRGEGYDHSTRSGGGKVWGAKDDVGGCDTDVSLMRDVSVLMYVVQLIVKLCMYFVSSG